MSLITIGTSVVDVADVALVAPRGSASQVYLADGSQLASALSAAAQAAAVNATGAGAQLTTVVVSTNFGSCYISGPNTQRVDTDAAGTGTIWQLRGGPGPVVCAATNLAAAQTLINATAASSGVNGGTVWTGGTITDTTGTLTITPSGPQLYTRNGSVVSLYIRAGVSGVANATPIIEFTGLPFPADPTGGFTYTSAPYAASLAIMSVPNASTLRMTWASPTGGALTGAIQYTLTYRAA